MSLIYTMQSLYVFFFIILHTQTKVWLLFFINMFKNKWNLFLYIQFKVKILINGGKTDFTAKFVGSVFSYYCYIVNQLYLNLYLTLLITNTYMV